METTSLKIIYIMKKFSEQFKKKSDNIRLRASERNDLRERLTSYMEYHQLPAEFKTQRSSLTQGQSSGLASETFKVFFVSKTYVRSLAGVFAILLVVGIPVVAETAVPGDMLYAVKTNFTEEVRASLTLAPYAKVEWETQRLERRVAEARLLATEGKLTPETEETVAQAVQEHTDAANKEIASMRETDEDEAAMAEIAFASAMSVQSEVLQRQKQNEDESPEGGVEGRSIAALADVVQDVQSKADVAQAGATPSYDGLLAKVESATTDAYELSESVNKSADVEEIVDIERRLADVERKLSAAITLHTSVPVENEVAAVEQEILEVEVVASTTDIAQEEQNVEPEASVPVVPLDTKEQDAQAIELLRAALTDVQKLIIFMTDIDVRQNVTIEKLVPVTPTNEEWTKTILNQLDEVLLMQANIELRTVPVERTEKVVLGKELLASHLTSVAQMLKNQNLDGAQQMLVEASAIVKDVKLLVGDAPLKDLIIEEPIAEEGATQEPVPDEELREAQEEEVGEEVEVE